MGTVGRKTQEDSCTDFVDDADDEVVAVNKNLDMNLRKTQLHEMSLHFYCCDLDHEQSMAYKET
jgi:hypothetical protein